MIVIPARIKYSLFVVFVFFAATFGRLSAQDKFELRGQVLDVFSKEPVRNASIIIKENKKGTITNDSGYFSITLFTPYCNVSVSAVGFIPAVRYVDLSENKETVVFELTRRANTELDEVIVNSFRGTSKVKTLEMNTVRINPELIKRTPLLFGEADILKALTLQPGVTTSGEGAGGFNVRGGNADQNLVLVDGAPLFNTSHLLGFFTSITPDAIQDVTLHKGSMPAEYGGRISSLLNIKVKNGNTKRMQYAAGIGPVSARFFANGPAVKNKLSFTGGVRVAYPDIILNQLPDKFGDSRAFFYDGIIKSELAINANNKISLTAYRSFDRFRFDTSTSYDWESNLAALNYSSEINSRLSLKIMAAYSQFISGIDNLEKGYESRLRSSISHKEGKAVLEYKINDNNKVTVGTNYIIYGVSPGIRTPTGNASNINPLAIQKEQGREAAVFLNDEITFTDKITLQLGLRYATYNYVGPKNVYNYEPGTPLSKESITDTVLFSKKKSIQTCGGFEPRVALKIGLSETQTFKLSYNHGQQFLQLVSNTTSISPVDFWKLSDKYIKQQSGDQFSAGYFQNFKNNMFELSFEAYYRTIKNMVDYKDGATLLLNPYIETALLNARGKGYGVEFSLVKNTGKFTGQINYTYSRSETQVITDFPSEKVNNGEWYPANTDRPHNLAVITRLRLTKGWSFNCNFIYTSGRPGTYPDGNYVYNNTLVTNYSRRNTDRLPAYHRLDAGFSWVSRRYPEQRRYSIVNISFYNLYMRQNAYSIYFNRNEAQLLSYRLSVVGGIIPSLSWTYNF